MPLGHPDAPPFPPLLASTGAPWSDVIQLAHYQLPPGAMPEHHAREHRVSLRLRGAGQVDWWIAGGRSQAMVRPGDFDLITAGVPYQARWDHACEVLLLGLEPGFVQAVTGHGAGGSIEFLLRLAAQDPTIQHLLLALHAELAAGCPSGRLFGEGLATALTAHLLRHHAAAPIRLETPRGGLPPARLRRVLDHIEAHLGADTSLRRLAALVPLSPHHFATAFKQSTGLSPHRYVLKRRMERAKELLVGSRLSVAEVGYALGFPNQAHFTTMFRKLVGTTPGAYRKRR